MSRPDDRPGDDRLSHEGRTGATRGMTPGADQGDDPGLRDTTRTSTRDAPAHDAPAAPVGGRAHHPARESFVGTDGDGRHNNASWGAIFAGAVTFFAVMLVFALITGALGLSDADGMAVGIWSIVAILLALAAAGYIAGALAVRAGFLHGLVTWATSLVGIVLLVGWVGSGVLSAVGGAAGTIAQTVAEATDTTVTEAAEQTDQEEVEAAQQEAEAAAQDTLAENEDEILEGAWWAVGGLVVGALIAGLAGAAGARSAQASHVADTRARRR